MEARWLKYILKLELYIQQKSTSKRKATQWYSQPERADIMCLQWPSQCDMQIELLWAEEINTKWDSKAFLLIILCFSCMYLLLKKTVYKYNIRQKEHKGCVHMEYYLRLYSVYELVYYYLEEKCNS